MYKHRAKKGPDETRAKIRPAGILIDPAGTASAVIVAVIKPLAGNLMPV